MFQQFFFLGQKIVKVFVYKLSGMWFIIYHIVYPKDTGVCLNNFFPLGEKLPWCFNVSYVVRGV